MSKRHYQCRFLRLCDVPRAQRSFCKAVTRVTHGRFVERICGVCAGVHALASVYAIEDAIGIGAG